MINSVHVSLTNLTTAESKAAIIPASFVQSGTRMEMGLGLADLLDEVNAVEGNDLVLTIQYYADNQYLSGIDSSVAFTYE